MDPTPFVYTRRVAFSDTDMAGIAHFTAILRWVEEAEAAWWRARGESLATRLADGSAEGWPKVSVAADFRAPARFDEVVEVGLAEAGGGEVSRAWRFVIRKESGGTVVAEGLMKTVRARVDRDGRVFVIPKPEVRA